MCIFEEETEDVCEMHHLMLICNHITEDSTLRAEESPSNKT